MKRIISLVLVMIMLLSMPVTVYADFVENKQPTSTYGDAMLEYLKTDNHKLLVVRGNYGYMQFADDFRQNVFSLYLLEMVDMLIETGTEPDQQKYMEVLINIIATYDLDNAADISEQNSMDNLKSLEDYAMDFVEMGANAVSVMVGNNLVASEFENDISTAIDRISVLKDNTNDWVEALSDLETIVQSYDRYDRFLELIENNAEGDLKIAASTLRTGMKKAFQIKLDTYADISDKNIENYSELFFEDVFWKALKEIPEYETDKSLKAFVDSGDSFVSKLDLLKSSWELGLGIGKLVGNVTVGGEDLINRVMEILALYDISSILQLEVSELGVEFFETIGTEKEADIIDEYSVLAQYLIGCRVRGEYCLYSIVANDAGLLSWFNKESAEEAKIWYEYKTEKILDIQAELLEVSQGDTVLVSDSFNDIVIDSTGKLYCYHIPQVNLSGNLGSAINSKMYQQLSSILDKEVDFNADDENYYPLLSEMVYAWGQNDEMVSIIVETNQTDFAWTEYYVYNISSNTGNEVSTEQLLEIYNLSKDDFYNLAKDTMKKYWDSRSDVISFVGQEEYNILVERTLEEENVKIAVPYINTKGELCIVANIYSPAGGDSYFHLLNTVSGAEEGYLECQMEHLNENNSVEDDNMGTMEDVSDDNNLEIKISEEDAVNIAQEYWGVKIGDISEETGFPLTIQVQGMEDNEYHVALRWLVENSHWSTIDIICIDVITGECRSYYE